MTCTLVAIMVFMMGSTSAIKPILLTKVQPPAETKDCQHTYLIIDKNNYRTFFPVMVNNDVKEEISGTVGSVQIKNINGAVLVEALVPMVFKDGDRFDLQLKRPKGAIEFNVEIMYEVIVDGRFCTKYRKDVKPDGTSSNPNPIYFCTI